MRKYIHQLSILTLALSMASCHSVVKVTRENYTETHHLRYSRPVAIPISDKIFCDIKEISNLDWLSYTSWLRAIFGENSSAFKEGNPENLVWTFFGKTGEINSMYYHGHPAYQWYPVVGVTQEQIEKFSNWRSDRIFERLLRSFSMIDKEWRQTEDNYFTIENYYLGKVPLTTNERLEYYPEFRLPSLDERKRILIVADSIDESFVQSLSKRRKRKLHEPIPFICCERLSKDTLLKYVTVPTGLYALEKFSDNLNLEIQARTRFIRRSDFLYHVRGNVSEWLAEDGLAAGGSWIDSLQTIRRQDIFPTISANAWTGFRNVYTWKKWEGVK